MAIVRYESATKATNAAPVKSSELKGVDKQFLAFKFKLTEAMGTAPRAVFLWEGSGNIIAVQSALLQKADGTSIGIAKTTITDNVVTMTAAADPLVNAVLTLSLIVGV